MKAPPARCRRPGVGAAAKRLPRAVAAVVWTGALLAPARAAEPDVSRRLAIDLDARGQHEAAAVEYRRLALSADDAAEQAGYYWAAAYEYRRAGLSDLAARMLDRAEDRSPALRAPVALLRAETALDDGRAAEAEFHIATLIEGAAAPDETLRDFLARRLARARLLQGDVDGAAAALNDLTAPSDKARQSLARYRREHDRIPWIGGALGAVPGLGYAYSGEFANAARSLLLNGLFIFGMAHTAEREQWGAFAIISFFELTWYTGSIYGGMDAAHRHNRERLEACLTDIDGGAAYSADLGRLPLVSISFGF